MKYIREISKRPPTINTFYISIELCQCSRMNIQFQEKWKDAYFILLKDSSEFFLALLSLFQFTYNKMHYLTYVVIADSQVSSNLIKI